MTVNEDPRQLFNLNCKWYFEGWGGGGRRGGEGGRGALLLVGAPYSIYLAVGTALLIKMITSQT